MDDAAFQTARTAAYNGVPVPDYNGDDCVMGLNAMVLMKSPHQVLQKAKRDVRRKMRKPSHMTVRVWWAHIQRIVNQDIKNLPPDYENNVTINDDELVDVLLYSIPQSWSREMDKFGIDPFRDIGATLSFCERMEAAEGGETKKSNSNNSQKKKAKTQKKSGKKSDGDGDFYCELHGKNASHSTSDCYAIKKLVKASKEGSTNNKGSKNKTWKKDSKKDSTEKKESMAVSFENRKRKAEEEVNLAEMDFDNLLGSDLDDEEVSV